MTGSRANLPEVFTELGQNYFSLGQDVSYYESINELGDEYRENIHASLRDVSFDEDLLGQVIDQRVMGRSLLRSVSLRSVQGQFNRLANGNATLTPYEFTYTSFTSKRGIDSMALDFVVKPKSNPPTNIHVLIGRNGVGKTRLLNHMVECLLEENALKYGRFSSPIADKATEIFANLIAVTFSAFDETEPKPERKNKTLGISYSYIGLKDEKKDSKSPTKLKNEFARSAYICKIGGKLKRLNRAIVSLESDPIFRDADLKSIFQYAGQKEFESVAAGIFHRLSSGHKIVLLTITRLVETLEERSLVLIDEPEAHLHPPLLATFVRVLSDLLVLRNAVAIVATHSPVVLQEVPKSCCWKLRRTGAVAIAERLEIESFGENVGSLTQEVFGLEVTDSGFHTLLEAAAKRRYSYEQIIGLFDDQLGFEARAILRSLIKKNEGNEDDPDSN